MKPARKRTWFGEDEVTAEIYLLRALIKRPVVSIEEAMPLVEAHRLLVDERVPALVVVENGELCGIVTRTDVLRALLDGGTMARDAMSSYVFAIPIDSTIEAAAALIAIEEVGQVIVTGRDNELVGMISGVDIARHIAAKAGYLP